MADPILAEIERGRTQNKTVVLAEVLLPRAEDATEERIRPSRFATVSCRPDWTNVRADADGVLRRA